MRKSVPAAFSAVLLASASLLSLAPFSAFAAEPAAKLATLSEAWKGGPAREQGADYCVQEARFSSGHLLIIGRTKAGEVNLALGIPGGGLPVGERWKVTVTADGAAPRERQAVAASKGLLVVGMGFDTEFYDRLKRGKTLNLKSAADDIAFQLSGTAKALGELEKCAAGLPDPKAGGKVASGAPGGAGAPPFPETLAAILGAAGLREVQTLAFPDVPADQRPADYAWRVGRVLGGVRERIVPEGTSFDEVSTKYAQALRDRCKGAGSLNNGPIERHPGVSLRSATVNCEGEGGKGAVHVAIVSYLSDANMFAVFFHEAVPAHKAEADDIRDRLTAVFRRVAQQEAAPPPAPSPRTAPAAPPPPAPPSAAAAKETPVPPPAAPSESPKAAPPSESESQGIAPTPPAEPAVVETSSPTTTNGESAAQASAPVAAPVAGAVPLPSHKPAPPTAATAPAAPAKAAVSPAPGKQHPVKQPATQPAAHPAKPPQKTEKPAAAAKPAAAVKSTPVMPAPTTPSSSASPASGAPAAPTATSP